MIDKKAREEALDIIQEFIHKKISNFELKRRLKKLKSDDKIIEIIKREIWYFYDDNKEHKANINEEGLNYIKQLLELLKSKKQVVVTYNFKFKYLILFIILFFALYYQSIKYYPSIFFIIFFIYYMVMKINNEFEYRVYPFKLAENTLENIKKSNFIKYRINKITYLDNKKDNKEILWLFIKSFIFKIIFIPLILIFEIISIKELRIKE